MNWFACVGEARLFQQGNAIFRRGRLGLVFAGWLRGRGNAEVVAGQVC